MEQLDQIRQRVNIVDLISESITLKKAGRNFKGLCPFHSEKTSSFIVSPERQIWHCFGCFPPGELVKTPFGYHPIEQLDQNHWVISGTGNLRKINSVIIRDYQGNLIKIILRKLRYEVNLTSDHNVFVVRGAPYTQKKYKNFARRYKRYLKFRKDNPNKYKYLLNKYFPIIEVPAGELHQEDLLLYPIRRDETDIKVIDLNNYLTKYTNYGPTSKNVTFKIQVDKNLLKLIGYYIAEGSNHRAYIRFSLGNHEEDFAQEIIYLIKKVFALEAKIHRRKTSKRTGLEITICQSQLANIFENFCGKGAENKHIPFIFQELPSLKQQILLKAIYRGDGSTFRANRSQNWHKKITSISRVLAEQLVDILLRLNYFPTLSIEKSKIGKLGVNHKQSYKVSWSETAKQKYSIIYYKDDCTQYWVLPIAKINKERYAGKVYNLNVAQDHSYLTSSFVVANCGKGGDIFTFLMELEHIEFPESLKILAARTGVTLKRYPVTTQQQQLKQKLLEIHHLTQEFYHYLLQKHDIGGRARDYLKQRGITDSIWETFSLGFAPNSWDNLTKFLRKKGYSAQELEKSGLMLKGISGWYDRFRNRIIFPLKNHRGETIAFAGRILDKSIHEAKYINSPETPLYIKGNTLYGLDVTKEAIRKEENAVIVEGEFDLISSYQVGVSNVVAIKGSAISETQINLLKRFTEQITLALDQDSAGEAASRRGIEMADKAGLNIKVINIPQGKDPDEAARTNAVLWKKAVKEAIPFYDFLFNSAFKRFDPAEPFGKKKISDELLPSLAKIENTIVKSHYLNLLAQKLNVSEEVITEAMKKIRYPASIGLISDSSRERQVPTFDELLEEHLLTLIIQCNEIKKSVELVTEKLKIDDFVNNAIKKIFFALVEAYSQEQFDITLFTRSLPKELMPAFDKAYLSDPSQFSDKLKLEKELEKTIQALQKRQIRRKIRFLSTDIIKAESNDDEESLTVLKEELQRTTAILKKLS